VWSLVTRHVSNSCSRGSVAASTSAPVQHGRGAHGPALLNTFFTNALTLPDSWTTARLALPDSWIMARLLAEQPRSTRRSCNHLKTSPSSEAKLGHVGRNVASAARVFAE